MPASRLVGPIALLALLAASARADVAGLPLPRGTRPTATAGLYLSGRGFRDTCDLYARHLKQHGLLARALPIERRHGVALARFVADPVRTWRAIHVFQQGGRTYIYVVVAGEPGSAEATAPGS